MSYLPDPTLVSDDVRMLMTSFYEVYEVNDHRDEMLTKLLSEAQLETGGLCGRLESLQVSFIAFSLSRQRTAGNFYGRGFHHDAWWDCLTTARFVLSDGLFCQSIWRCLGRSSSRPAFYMPCICFISRNPLAF